MSYRVEVLRVTSKAGFQTSHKLSVFWNDLRLSVAPQPLQSMLGKEICRARNKRQCHTACPQQRWLEGFYKIFLMSGNNNFVRRQKLSHLNNIFPEVLSQSPRAFLPKNEIFGSPGAFFVFLPMLLILQTAFLQNNFWTTVSSSAHQRKKEKTTFYLTLQLQTVTWLYCKVYHLLAKQSISVACIYT